MPRRPVDTVRRLLIIAPPTGRVKSLIAGSDPNSAPSEKANALATAFLRDTIEKAARPFVPCDVWLAHDGSPAELPEALQSGILTIPQEGADFGEQMAQLFARGFAERYDHILAMGSDTPHLPPAFLIDAWGRLRDNQTDVVLGPTDNGGYYLLGLKQNRPALLQNIAWKSVGTLGTTRETLQNVGLRIAQTPAWYAIDTESDVQRLRTDLARGSVVAPHTQATLSQLF